MTDHAVFKPPVTWWGRYPSMNDYGHHLWTQVTLPAGETPWTWEDMPWHPITVWLPHPPVRNRKR